MTKKPKRANLKPPGRCIYCNSLGLTKEHIWADWLREYIPRQMQEHKVSKTIVFRDRQEVSIDRRTGDPHARRVHCVCKPCNSGWMSQLQERAKPFLVPMLTGSPVTLHKGGKTAIAAWVAMMVMVVEFIDLKKIAVPPEDRRWLSTHHFPPSHWRIWIGRYQRVRHPILTHNTLRFAIQKSEKVIPSGLAKEMNTQTTTICVGKHLLIHVISSPIARSIIRRWHLPDEVAAGMSQVWPIRDGAIRWPSPLVINDSGIDLVAQQFFKAAQWLDRFTPPMP